MWGRDQVAECKANHGAVNRGVLAYVRIPPASSRMQGGGGVGSDPTALGCVGRGLAVYVGCCVAPREAYSLQVA